MKNKILCVAAGGSGGHILPALVIAKQWKNQNPNGKIVFFCQDNKLDQEILSQHKMVDQIITLPACKLFIKKPWLYPKFIYEVTKGFFKSFAHIKKINPEKIISTGGGTSLPVCLAGWLLKQNIEIYELNVEPGKSIKVLGLFASKIFIAFEESKKLLKFLGINLASKCFLTNYPIRFTEADKHVDLDFIINEINQQMSSCAHAECRSHGSIRALCAHSPRAIGVSKHANHEQPFDSTRKTLFLFGGSQGSIFLNNLLKQLFEKKESLADKIQIIHQVGVKDDFDWNSFYAQHKIPALTFSYNPNLQKFFLLSDLIICRAGAGTMFEIEFFNKKCLVIPLVAASTGHQVLNAYAMQRRHPNLFTVLEQSVAQQAPEKFNDLVLRLLGI